MTSIPSLYDCLDQLPREQQALLPVTGPIEGWTDQLLNPKRLTAWLSTITESTRTVLRAWLRGRFALSHQLSHMNPSQLSDVLQDLQHSGVGFQIPNYPLHLGLIIPFDYFAPLFTLLEDIPWETFLTQESAPRQTRTASHWSGFFHDLFQLLSMARRTPLSVTQQSTLYKRVQTKLTERFWPVSPEERHARVGVLLAYCQKRGLLRLEESPFQLVTSTKTEYFLSALDSSSVSAAYSHQLFDQFGAGGTESALLTILALAPEDRYVRLGPVLEWLNQQSFPHASSAYTWQEMRQHLLGHGALQEKSHQLIRLSDYASATIHRLTEPILAKHIMIEPSGDIMIPPESPFKERWQIDSLAQFVRSDRMTLYRITRDSVAQALNDGWTKDAYLQTLNQVSKTSLPANVALNVGDWFRALSRHRMVEAVVLHSADEEESQLAERVVAKWSRGRLSPLDLILPKDQIASVRKALDRAGIPVRPGTAKLSDPVPEPDEQIDADLLYEDDYIYMVELPHPPKHIAINSTVTHALQNAIGHGHSLWIDYRPPSHLSAVPLHIVPVKLADDSCYALDLSTGRYLHLDLASVVTVRPSGKPS